MGTSAFTKQFGSYDAATGSYLYSASNQSLTVSILSAGTFFGALISGSFADWIGRRSTIIMGCGIFAVGVVLQMASSEIALLAVGRIIAGLGVGVGPPIDFTCPTDAKTNHSLFQLSTFFT